MTKLVYNDGPEIQGLQPFVQINGNDDVEIGAAWDAEGDPTDAQYDIEGNDSFVLEFVGIGDWDEIEVWLEFSSVDVDDTGNIYANFTGLLGQFSDGDTLIGRARAGELEVIVRDYTSFVDRGEVEFRIAEDLAGTWRETKDKELRLRLPRYFVWGTDNDSPDIFDFNQVFGTEYDQDDFNFRLSLDKRDLLISLADGEVLNEERVRFDFKAYVVVDDEDRASKGDVVATTGGDYDVIPDELIVGVYGDYDITITADDVDRFHHLPCLAAG